MVKGCCLYNKYTNLLSITTVKHPHFVGCSTKRRTTPVLGAHTVSEKNVVGDIQRGHALSFVDVGHDEDCGDG